MVKSKADGAKGCGLMRRCLTLSGLSIVLASLAAPVVFGQTYPTAVSEIRPIFQTQGVFKTGLAYQVFITPGRVSLAITNNTGSTLDSGVTAWLGLLDEKQAVQEVLVFDFPGSIEVGQTTAPLVGKGTAPTDAKFYKLIYWDGAGTVRPPGRLTIFQMTEPRTPKLTHETADFVIAFEIIPKQIGFVLTNRSQSLIRLIWDESVFIDQKGRTHRAMHEGIRFIERDRPMPPTPIPPGARLEDLFYPVTYVEYISGRYGGWNQNPLYKDTDQVPFSLGIFMTLEIGSAKRGFSYRFTASRDWPAEVRALFSQ